MEENTTKSDWNISDLYEKAWQIIKKNKVLWIFGIAVAGYSGGSNFNSGSSRDFEEKDIENFQHLFNNQESFGNFTNVLGTATNEPFTESLKAAFSSIPASFWFILALEIIALILIYIVIFLVASAWANASLIQGIQMAINNQKVTIQDASLKAFASIKGLIWLSIISFLIVVGLVAIPIFLLMILHALVNSAGLTVLLAIPTGIAVFVGIILMTMTEIWAVRKVVLEGTPAIEALKRSFNIAKRKFWSMFLLGVVNTILAGLIMLVPILIFGGALLGGVFGGIANRELIPTLIIGGVILFLVFAIAHAFLSGVITAFKATVWSLAYKQIKGKYEQ